MAELISKKQLRRLIAETIEVMILDLRDRRLMGDDSLPVPCSSLRDLFESEEDSRITKQRLQQLIDEEFSRAILELSDGRNG